MYFSQTVESAFSIAINSALYDKHFPPAGTPMHSFGSSVPGHSMMMPGWLQMLLQEGLKNFQRGHRCYCRDLRSSQKGHRRYQSGHRCYSGGLRRSQSGHRCYCMGILRYQRGYCVGLRISQSGHRGYSWASEGSSVATEGTVGVSEATVWVLG